jgi:hypothetical protein
VQGHGNNDFSRERALLPIIAHQLSQGDGQILEVRVLEAVNGLAQGPIKVGNRTNAIYLQRVALTKGTEVIVVPGATTVGAEGWFN